MSDSQKFNPDIDLAFEKMGFQEGWGNAFRQLEELTMI